MRTRPTIFRCLKRTTPTRNALIATYATAALVTAGLVMLTGSAHGAVQSITSTDPVPYGGPWSVTVTADAPFTVEWEAGIMVYYGDSAHSCVGITARSIRYIKVQCAAGTDTLSYYKIGRAHV
jgi:hypothetical protein